MSDKFTTKRGKGAVCYRIPRKEKGRTTYTSDYHRRITKAGKQHYFNLGSDKRTAEAISNAIDDFLRDPRNSIEDAKRKFNPDSVLKDGNKLTVADIIRCHEKVEKRLEIREKTARHYRSCLMWVVRRVVAYRRKSPMPGFCGYSNALSQIEDFSVSNLHGRFLSDLKMAAMGDAGEMIKDQNAAKRKLNSVLSDARSIFSESAIEEYRHAGLEVPEIDGFMKGRLFRRVSKKRYRLPKPEVITGLFESMDELRFNPNAYRMFLLAIGAGLRRGEIYNCRRSWLVDGETPTIVIKEQGEWEQKHGGEDYSEICPWAYRELLATLKPKADCIIEGTQKQIESDTRWFCEWLRDKGIDREHPIHELRMLCGCWIANRRGLYVAQKLLRHTSAQVTSDHYADFVPDNKVLACWDGLLKATGS